MMSIFIILIFLLVDKCVNSDLNCRDKAEVDKYILELEKNQSSLFSYYANVTRNENLENYFQDAEILRDMSLTIDDILPVNKSLYLKRRPPTVCGRPAHVIYHVLVLSLDSINEASMTYNLDIWLTVCWVDHRLRFPETSRAYRILDVNWLGTIWQPDTVFKNARDVGFLDKLVPNHYLWMLPNKELVYATKLTLLLTCNMDFRTYPHDTQECSFDLESMTYTTQELVFKWDTEDAMKFANTSDKIQTPQFQLVYNKAESCKVSYMTGSYTCIRAVFYLRRRLGYHLIHTYFPSGLIVVLSWITFWIKPRDIAARIGLGVTSLLTLATLSTQAQNSLPPVSYRKAIDIWMSCCALFVFSSILEFAVVNYLVCRFPSDDVSVECHSSKTFRNKLQAYFSNSTIQIIAHNIDRISRIFFPLCFVILNWWYWRKYLQDEHINGVKVEENEI